MIKKITYPKMLHLPNSIGVKPTDEVMKSYDYNGEVVVTEKMDGDNTILRVVEDDFYSTTPHDRLLKNWWKFAKQEVIDYPAAHLFSPVCDTSLHVENLYVKHSIKYTNLQHYALAFSVWHKHWCAPWKVVEDLEACGISHVPVIYKGEYDADAIHEAWKELKHESEGYVVRPTCGFHKDQYQQLVGKYVHRVLDNEWMKHRIEYNERREQ